MDAVRIVRRSPKEQLWGAWTQEAGSVGMDSSGYMQLYLGRKLDKPGSWE